MQKTPDWKTKTLVIGAIIGLITGIIGALIIVQNAEQTEERHKFTAGEGVKLGLGVMTLLRLVSDTITKR